MIVDTWREEVYRKDGSKYEKEFTKKISYASVALFIAGTVGVVFAVYFGIRDDYTFLSLVLYCVPGIISIFVAIKNMFVQTVREVPVPVSM